MTGGVNAEVPDPMLHAALVLVSLPFLITPTAAAQGESRTGPPAAAAQALLGACFTPVPEILSVHVAALPETGGLVVDEVEKHSPAAALGLRRLDVLLKCNGQAVEDVKHLAGLLWATPADAPARLEILRRGRLLTLSHPVAWPEPASLLKSVVKTEGPPAVNVQARPLPDGKLQVTLTYYAGGASKLQRITCSGSVDEIESHVHEVTRRQQLPVTVQDLLGVALTRLRALNSGD